MNFIHDKEIFLLVWQRFTLIRALCSMYVCCDIQVNEDTGAVRSMRRMGGDPNGSAEDDAGPGRVTLLVSAWALPVVSDAANEDGAGSATAAAAGASSSWAARMHGVDLVQASGLQQAFVSAGLRALGTTIDRAVASASPPYRETQNEFVDSAVTHQADGNAELGTSNHATAASSLSFSPSPTLTLSLAFARFTRRGPLGQWPLTGLAAPSSVNFGGSHASNNPSERAFLVQGNNGWCLKAPLPHLRADPKLVRFLRSRTEAYAFSALNMNSSCSSQQKHRGTVSSNHKGRSSSSSGSREEWWWWVGTLPWRVFSAAARAAGEPTSRWTKADKAAAPQCTFLVSANNGAGWNGSASLLLLLRTPSDDHGSKEMSVAEEAQGDCGGSIAKWATSLRAVEVLLEATRGHLWSVVERAAADLISVQAWQEVLRAGLVDVAEEDLWAPLIGQRNREVISDSTHGTSSAAAALTLESVSTRSKSRRSRRGLRVPLLALHAGLTQYTPNRGMQEEERVGSSEEDDDDRANDEGMEEEHDDKRSGEVAIASSLSGGLQALLLACPVVPLSDLDDRLDTLFVPPSPDSTLDGPHEERARVASISGNVLFQSSLQGSDNSNFLLSPEGNLCATWASALEKLRTKHEATAGAQALLFADPLSVRETALGSDLPGFEDTSDHAGDVDSHQDMPLVLGECHMLLLPPPPSPDSEKPADEASPQLPDLNHNGSEDTQGRKSKETSTRVPRASSVADSDGVAAEESALSLLAAFETSPSGALLLSWRGPSALASKRPGAVRARIVCFSGVHASTVTLGGASLSPPSAAPSSIGAEDTGSDRRGSNLEVHVRSLVASFAPCRGTASFDAQVKEALAASEVIDATDGATEREALDADVLPEGALPGWMMGSLPCGVRQQPRQQEQQCALS